MSKLSKALIAAAGNSGGAGLMVEDVFSTYLYTGTGATQTITNGIDLDGEGGMVWIKGRTDAGTYPVIVDTSRGANKWLYTSGTSAQATSTSSVTSFNSNGFSLGADNGSGDTNSVNYNYSSPSNYASWTFRKAEKFFDVVTYTGDGVAGREIAHNLNSVPACIIVKNISLSGYNWQVYHTSTGNTDYLNLNDADATASFIGAWNNTSPTSTHFTLGNWAQTNDAAGSTYVAYLFASDAGGFGDDGSESIIKCGSYTGNGSTDGPVIDLGFEPQWVMIKRASASGTGWYMHDIMRGMPNGGTDSWLEANSSAAEVNSIDWIHPTATGFNITNTQSGINGSGDTYIYIAIRRPMKTPESGTEVFNPDLANASVAPLWEAPFPVDLGMYAKRDSATATFYAGTRLTGTGRLSTWTTTAEVTDGSFKWDYMDGWFNNAFTDSQYLGYGFKRATGFFDVVAYTGNGTAGRTVAHNLGVAPELMIVKSRSNGAYNWMVYHHSLGNTNYLRLNEIIQTLASAGSWNNTTPTDSEFTLGGASVTNGSGETFIAYLFATLAGVSKVGSYTGTGSNVDVDCGFSAGARFILIKRTDSTGDWYVWDSVRGIVAGNDPYLLLNSTATEVTSTDYIDPLSSGFTVTSSAPAALNASGGNYIFLAIS